MKRIALRSVLIASLALVSTCLYEGLLYYRSKPRMNWGWTLYATILIYFDNILFISSILFICLFLFTRVKKVNSLIDYILLKILYYLVIGVLVFFYFYLLDRTDFSKAFTNAVILFFSIFLFDVIFNSRFEQSNNEIIINWKPSWLCSHISKISP